jgi:putative cardiolipin synthase
METMWGRTFASGDQPLTALSGFDLLQEGVDGLAARVQIIRGAERSLDLQYFIFRGDATGSLIRQELRDAADRGVRIRVLVDDGDTAAGDEKLLELDGYRDMQVRVFNPFTYRGHNKVLRNLDFVMHKDRLDYRMHNKVLVADNALALVGGRNIGNQYFQVDPKSQFADVDVFTVGACVEALSGAFEQFWNSELAVPAAGLARPEKQRASMPTPLPPDYLRRVESGEPLEGLMNKSTPLKWAEGQIFYDSPEKRLIERKQSGGQLMSRAVEHEIERSIKEVEIVSPYFVPSDKELELLKDARTRGDKVGVLTNSLETNPEIAAHSGYSKVRIPLLEAGTSMYEIRAKLDNVKGSGESRQIARFGNYALHGKIYIFDRRRVFVGSWNYDQRSLRLNIEIGVLIESAPVAEEVLHRFDEMTSPPEAYQVVLDSSDKHKPRLLWKTEIENQERVLKKEPSRGWFQRLKARLLSLLPLQSEL